MSEHSPPDDPLLTVAEVADRLKVNERWVYQEIRAGRLAKVEFARNLYRIKTSALAAFVASREAAQAETTPPAA